MTVMTSADSERVDLQDGWTSEKLACVGKLEAGAAPVTWRSCGRHLAQARRINECKAHQTSSLQSGLAALWVLAMPQAIASVLTPNRFVGPIIVYGNPCSS